jgi:hypothetical protein
MSSFPSDILAALEIDRTPGEPMPVGPSPEVEAARGARIRPEDIERLAHEDVTPESADDQPSEAQGEWSAAQIARLRASVQAEKAGHALTEEELALVGRPEPESPPTDPAEYAAFIDRHYPGMRGGSW